MLQPGRAGPMLEWVYGGRRYSGDSILVGQGGDAEIRLPNRGVYEDERLALLRIVDQKPCLLVLSDAEPISVNGKAVSGFCFLEAGDVIQACGETIRCRKAEGPDHGMITRRFRILAGAIALLALLFGAFLWLSSVSRGIQAGDESACRSSVYHIRVGYVLLQEADGQGGYRTLDSLLADGHVGTGFVTTDGRFVTARHVAEPWMNPSDTLFTDWAVQVENTNREARREVMRMITRLRAVNVDGRRLDFCTDSAHINRSRDRIFNAGTRTEPRWRRSISIVFNDFDCALGDCAWFTVPQKGTVRLASSDRFARLKAGDPLLFVGSQSVRDPEEHVILSPTGGRLKNTPGHGCLLHSSQFDPGDSGGPVLARVGGRVVLVGIISRKDADRKETTGWSVPVTELYGNGQ